MKYLKGEFPPYKGIDFTKPLQVCLDVGFEAPCPNWLDCVYHDDKKSVEHDGHFYKLGSGLELRNVILRTDEEIDAGLKKSIAALKAEANAEKKQNKELLNKVIYKGN